MSTIIAATPTAAPLTPNCGRQWLPFLELCHHPAEFAQTHAALTKLGLIRHTLFATRLAAHCALSPCPATADYACRLFDLDPNPNTFAYNVLIRGLVRRNHPSAALALFADMLRRGGAPNSLTFPFVLKACSDLPSAALGGAAHAQVCKLGLSCDLYIQNTLLLMYMRIGSPSAALQLFDRMPQRDAVSWNTVVDGLSKLGLLREAQSLFDEMPERNTASWNCIIDAYVQFGSLEMARELFDRAPAKNYVTWNIMIGGYAGCGSMEAARDLFDRMPWGMKDLTSLKVMIDGYMRGCCYGEVLEVFDEMVRLKIEPDAFMLVSVLSACAHLATLEPGEWVHGYIDRSGMVVDSVIGTALADMYAKNGRMERAVDVFNAMKERDVGAWNCMIANLGDHGRGREALALFFKMLDAGIASDEVTFLNILSSCRHSGLVDAGHQVLYLMKDVHCIAPKAEHWGCMVDLLCRAGMMGEARELIEVSDARFSVAAWGALVGAATRVGDVEMCEYAAKRLLELDPRDVKCCVELSNMYKREKLWEDAVEVRKEMRTGGMEKVPGYSSIEVGGVVHEFRVGSNDLS